MQPVGSVVLGGLRFDVGASVGGQTESCKGRRLRVMLLTSGLHYGGAERQVVELAKQLDRERFEPMLCSLDGTRTLFDLNPSDTPIVMAKRRARFDPIPFWQVGRTMRREAIDVVHCFLFDAEVIGRLMGRLTGVPAVIASERNSDYPVMPIKDRVQRATRSMVDLVIANSHAGKEYACGHLGFVDDRVVVVHNGVDVERFVPGDKAAARQRIGISGDGPVVGMFASFKAQKNHAMYFRVAQRVIDRIPEVTFLSVSHTPTGDRMSEAYQESLNSMLDELQLWDRVKILTNRDDVEELYRACDLTLLTSKREGTPNVVLESMASGVPVVATDVADNWLILGEASGGGVIGLDDDAAMVDVVCRKLADREALKAAGERARAKVEREYSLTMWADRMGDHYEATHARKTGRVPRLKLDKEAEEADRSSTV